MNIAKPSKYHLLGTSLALMLQSNYRFVGPIGIGELLTIAYLIFSLMSWASNRREQRRGRPDTLTSLFLRVVLLLITPMTLLSTAMDIPGSSIRDLFSYYFVCAVLFILPSGERDVRAVIVSFLVVLFLSIGVQYVVGGPAAYYFSRFTGGAKNPNQLALYLVSAVALSAYLPSFTARVIVAALTITFGIVASSDALFVSLAASLLVFVVLTIVPSRAVLLALPSMLLLSYIAALHSGVSETLLHSWTLADEGNTRTRLYISGLDAWMASPLSLFLGHGAGSFSGLYGPFETAEAHNTAIDLATVAGLFGLLLFPVQPVWMAMKSLSNKQRFVPAVIIGLIIFALFHFVGRQPVFWVSLVLIARLIRAEYMTEVDRAERDRSRREHHA